MQSQDHELVALRTPPHSIEAEQAVLGGLLRDNTAWDKIGDLISAVDFYRFDHRLIFQATAMLITSGRPADVITVHDALVGKGKAEECGGLMYLNAMAQSTPSTANITRYAEIVRGRGILRTLIAAANEICDEAYSAQGKDVMAILTDAEAKIFSIAAARAKPADGGKALQPLLSEVVEEIDALYSRENPSAVTGLATGFTDLDRETTGLHPGDLVIVAGRPSMGKTAMAMNIAENVALSTDSQIVIFSMEMGGTQLARRMLGSVGQLDQQRLRTGTLADEDWPRLTHAIHKLNSVKVHIDETGCLSPGELRSRALRQARQDGPIGLVIVDYIQLMVSNSSKNSRGTEQTRAGELSEISRALKGLAKELRCPVIALSQLNRTLENRPNKRPIMADIRESGAIEQDADLIFFLYRDEVYNPDSQDKGTAELIIAKQRNGPIGTVRLAWTSAHTRFSDYANATRSQ